MWHMQLFIVSKKDEIKMPQRAMKLINSILYKIGPCALSVCSHKLMHY